MGAGSIELEEAYDALHHDFLSLEKTYTLYVHDDVPPGENPTQICPLFYGKSYQSNSGKI